MTNPFKTYSNILNKYLFKETIPYIEKAWNEPHRDYHNINHLNDIIAYIENKRFNLSPDQFDALILGAFFHDVYYDTRENKNYEDESIKKFLASYSHKNYNTKNLVVALIEATKYRKRPDHYLIKLFWEADNNGFYKEYDNLLKTEQQIRNEYKHVFNSIYKKNRIEFLKKNLGLFNSKVDSNLLKLIEHVKKIY